MPLLSDVFRACASQPTRSADCAPRRRHTIPAVEGRGTTLRRGNPFLVRPDLGPKVLSAAVGKASAELGTPAALVKRASQPWCHFGAERDELSSRATVTLVWGPCASRNAASPATSRAATAVDRMRAISAHLPRRCPPRTRCGSSLRARPTRRTARHTRPTTSPR